MIYSTTPTQQALLLLQDNDSRAKLLFYYQQVTFNQCCTNYMYYTDTQAVTHMTLSKHTHLLRLPHVIWQHPQTLTVENVDNSTPEWNSTHTKKRSHQQARLMKTLAAVITTDGFVCWFRTLKLVSGNFFFFSFLVLHLSIVGNSSHLTSMGMTTAAARAALPTPNSVWGILVWSKVWLPVSRIFNVCTGVNAYDCIWGLYGHCQKVCTETCFREKNPLPHWGIKPVSAGLVQCSTNYATSPPTFLPFSPPLCNDGWLGSMKWHTTQAMRGCQLRHCLGWGWLRLCS